ncbi:MAG: ABC transporter permease [Actinomycetota bacterium]
MTPTPTIDHRSAPTTSVAATHARSSAFQQLLRLYRTELRLFAREPQALVFVFGFPVLTVLVLGGVFGSANDDSGFEYINPQYFYTAAYFGVVLCAVATIMLPVHLAGYRERGVLRRFETSGFARWTVPAALFASGVTFAVLGFAALLATAAIAFGLPSVESPGRTALGLILGTAAFVSFGIALGSLMPTARAAQGLGLMLFFPMFLLAGGGPPPEALSDTMRTVADWLPLTHVIRAIQEPWLGLGAGGDHLAIVAGIMVASTAFWWWRTDHVGRAD